jgi:hypothetical protein
MRKIRLVPLMILLLCSAFAHAQSAATNNPVEMADGMRSNGKIYVVVGVLVLILVGLFAYLISIDRKIGRIEKDIEQGKNK